MLYTLSKQVDEGTLNAMQALECQLNHPVLALSAIDIRPAHLTEEEVSKLRSLERQLGLCLVAVEA